MDVVVDLIQKGEYRPIAVAVLYKVEYGEIKFLLTRSPKAENNWNFPQGGIKVDETIAEGLARELKTELGIEFDKEIGIVYDDVHYCELDLPDDRNKRGYSKGKAYFFTLCEFLGDKIKPSKDEIAEVKWCNYDDALETFKTCRKEKEVLLKHVMEKVNEILIK